MATTFSELELAIHTLVSEFHGAADDGPNLNASQFQNMMAKQLPEFAKQVETEEGLAQVLDQMGVKAGQSISFENFWTLIKKQAVQQFASSHKEKNTSCGCYLM